MQSGFPYKIKMKKIEEMEREREMFHTCKIFKRLRYGFFKIFCLLSSCGKVHCHRKGLYVVT